MDFNQHCLQYWHSLTRTAVASGPARTRHFGGRDPAISFRNPPNAVLIGERS